MHSHTLRTSTLGSHEIMCAMSHRSGEGETGNPNPQLLQKMCATSHSKGNMSDSNQLRKCVHSHTPRRSSGSASDHLRECVLSHICKQAHSDHQRECVHSHTLLRLGGISVSDHLRECVQCHTVASRPAQLRECVQCHT